MKEKVQAALDKYVLAYTNNDKELFASLWAPDAILRIQLEQSHVLA